MIRKAYYDIERDEIIGIKDKRTAEYWHEKGHQFLEHSLNYESTAIQIRSILLILTLVFLSIGRNQFALASIFGMISLEAMSEIGAWIYAFTHLKEWRPRPGTSKDRRRR